MSETMKELLIKQKENITNKVLGYALLAIALMCLGAVIFLQNPVFLIAVVLCPIISYFVYFKKMSVEYEYVYLDKELRVDRIYNMNKRKNVATLDILKIEIVAPAGSDALRGYANRKADFYDYSVGYNDEDTKVYEVWYDGKRRILMSLNDDFLIPMNRIIPQKIKKQ